MTSKEALVRLAEEGVEASLAAEWSPCLRLADTSSVASALRALRFLLSKIQRQIL